MKKSMTKAAIFDLDGTLVQTEKLKAISYERAADRTWVADEPGRLHAVLAERIESILLDRNCRGSGRVQVYD